MNRDQEEKVQGRQIDWITQAMTHRTGRRQVASGLLATVFAVPTGVTALAVTPEADKELRWLLVQAFAAATLAPDPSEAGAFVLTLAGLDEALLAFTDRPERQVMTLPTADFVAMVTGTNADPFNAMLVAPLEDGEPTSVAVELLAVEHDGAEGRLTYRVAVLASEEGEIRAAATPLALPTVEETFGPGHLFIDNACISCW